MSEDICLGKEKLKHGVRHGMAKRNRSKKAGKEMEGKLGRRQGVVQDEVV